MSVNKEKEAECCITAFMMLLSRLRTWVNRPGAASLRSLFSSPGAQEQTASMSEAPASTLHEALSQRQKVLSKKAEKPCFYRVRLQCNSTTPNDVRRLFTRQNISLDNSTVACEFTDQLQPTGHWLVSVESAESARKCKEHLTHRGNNLWNRLTRQPVVEQIPREMFETLKRQAVRPELQELRGRGVVVHNIPNDFKAGDVMKHFQDLQPEKIRIRGENNTKCALVRFKYPMQRYHALRNFSKLKNGKKLDITVVP